MVSVAIWPTWATWIRWHAMPSSFSMMRVRCAPWARRLALSHKYAFAPAESFPHTKTSTGASSSALHRSRPVPHRRPLPFVAVNRHPRGIAIQNLETLGNIGHANSRSPLAFCLRHLGRRHSNSIVFDLNHQARVRHATAQVDAAAFHLRGQSMLDRVLHQRL